LKLVYDCRVGLGRGVAPYTGAWIETSKPGKKVLTACVAPYTGAWIETPSTG